MGGRKILAASSIVALAIIAGIFIVAPGKKITLTPPSSPPSPPVATLTSEEIVASFGSDSTRELASKIAEELIKNNASGLPKTDTGEARLRAVLPTEIVNTALQSQISAALKQVSTVTLDESRFRIIPGTIENDTEYLRNLVFAVLQHFAGSASLIDPPTLDGFSALLPRYAKAIEAIYTLSVPENLLVIHREELRLLSLQKKALEAIVNYDTDPFAASVGGQLFLQSNTELENLAAVVTTFIKDNSIAL